MIFGEDAGRSAFFAEIGSKVEALSNIPSDYTNLVCIGRAVRLVDPVGRNYSIDLYASPGGRIAVRLPLSAQTSDDGRLRHLRRVASIIRTWSVEQLDEVCADSFYQSEGQAADIIDIFVRVGVASYQDRLGISRRLGETLATGELLFAVCDSAEECRPTACRDVLREFACAKGIDPDELTGFIGALEVLDGVSAVSIGWDVLVQYAPPGIGGPYQLMRFSVGRHRSDVFVEPRLTQHQLQRNGRSRSDADQFFEALIPYRLKFLLERNRRNDPTAKTYVKKNIHIFGGLVRCGKCGSNMIANLDRRRANGFRPSQYACGSRRRKGTDCTNKYISDAVLGPFVLNYVANIIRASKNSSETTTAETLERKLLRGDAFDDVASVSTEALEQLLASFNSAGDAVEYRPQLAFSGEDTSINETDALKAKKQRLENALARLNALYLYDDEAMPEKDFVMQRGQITKQLEEVNARLEVLQAQNSAGDELGDDFIRKASYYIMANKLIEDRYIDYEKYIRTIDPSVPKSFLSQIIDHIDVDDGRVTAITFKNGVEHRFTYNTLT